METAGAQTGTSAKVTIILEVFECLEGSTIYMDATVNTTLILAVVAVIEFTPHPSACRR